MCVFFISEFRGSTLSIDAVSMEKGIGTVYYEGDGFFGSSSRTFEITKKPPSDDLGVKRHYVIELPTGGLKTLRILPQVSKGSFIVGRVILANDTICYIWNEQGVCSQQNQVSGFHKKDPCIGGLPTITTSDDLSIVISAIPETGFKNTLELRIFKAITFSFGTLIGGLWMLWPLGKKLRNGDQYQHSVQFAWLVFVSLLIRHIYLVVTYSVDVPIVDEWIYFKADGLINGLTWQWLFKPEFEHRIVLTKLMAWLNYKLFGLNFVLQNVFNSLIFIGMVAAVVVFKNRVMGRGGFKLFPLFMIFMFSSIAMERHLWPSCSTFPLILLFSVLMLYQAYFSKLTVKDSLIFGLYAAISIYTFAAGVIFVVIYLFSMSVYIVAGVIGNRIDRVVGWRFLLTVFAVCGMSFCVWYLGYAPPKNYLPNVPLYDFRFWNYVLNIVSFGFGFNSVQILPGIVCLAIVVTPFVILLIKKETRWQPSTWSVLSSVMGILAVLFAISMGRSNMDWTPKMSRYAEIGFMLIPYTALGWWLAIKNAFSRYVVLSFLWLFCFIAFLDNWSTSGYALHKQANLYDLNYIEEYYSGIDIYPYLSTPADLDRARILGVRFSRQFTSVGGGEK